jgi:uncharacterized membrane protein YqjE
MVLHYFLFTHPQVHVHRTQIANLLLLLLMVLLLMLLLLLLLMVLLLLVGTISSTSPTATNNSTTFYIFTFITNVRHVTGHIFSYLYGWYATT